MPSLTTSLDMVPWYQVFNSDIMTKKIPSTLALKPPASSQHAPTLSTGQLATLTQLSRGALRLYEKHGLITAQHRTSSGYRVFAADTVVTLNAIKVACNAGFTLAEVRELLGLVDAETFSAAAVRSTLKEKILEVDARIAHLEHFKRFMQQVAKKPEILLDPACDAMLELAALASTQTKTKKVSL